MRKPGGDWGRNDSEKGDLFVNHSKTVFTPDIPNESVVLPLTATPSGTDVPPRLGIREIEKAIVDLN